MFKRSRIVCLSAIQLQRTTQLRWISFQDAKPKIEQKKIRNEIFDAEKKASIDKVGRIEKIDVVCTGPAYKVEMKMNKNISTPYDCAKHISEGVSKTSALALYNGKLWDMHEPLPEDGEITFLNLLNPSDTTVNNAYWRSCAFLLGAVIDSAFKAKVNVQIHSFPKPQINQGCFFHIAGINKPNWIPTKLELNLLTASFKQFADKNLEFEKLRVTEEIALAMFEDNPFKSSQIPHIAKHNSGIITLYRVGDHVDISTGPMIGNTYLIGNSTVTNAYQFYKKLYCFQGVSLPKGMMLNPYAYRILEKFAAEKKYPLEDKWKFSSGLSQEDGISNESINLRRVEAQN